MVFWFPRATGRRRGQLGWVALACLQERLFVIFTDNTSDAAFVLATLAAAVAWTPVRNAFEGTHSPAPW
jgi:hypothetical protein